MSFISEQSVFPALKSLWHFQGSQLSSYCILRTSQEMRHGKEAPLRRESSRLPRDQGAEVMESLFHQKAPGAAQLSSPGYHQGSWDQQWACWPRGIPGEGLGSVHHLQ